MKSLQAPDVRLFLGKGGSGKSTLARFQAGKFSRVIWFDPNGELSGKELEGAVLCSDRAYLLDLVCAPGPMRIIWRGVVTGGVEAFEWANRAAWASEDWLIVWDEVDRFVTPSKLPPFADNIVNAGRHRRLRLFAACRRPYRMNRTLSGMAGRMAIFRTTEPRDIRYFGEYIGAAADGLPSIPAYHALDWREGADEYPIKKSPFA